MKKILIGTHNEGKFIEISHLIAKKIKKISPVKLKIKSPKETYFSKFIDYPVISDDSGLCIKALNNKPGIYSARWAKKYGSFFKAMTFILKKMKNKKNRSATFVSCLAIKIPEKKTITVLGKIRGSISYKILGTKGFGYDSIFIPFSKSITFGQMSKIKKMKTDHRSVAFKKLKKKIKIL